MKKIASASWKKIFSRRRQKEIKRALTGLFLFRLLLRMDVLGLRAFLSVCDSELDLLSICQSFEAITLYLSLIHIS